MKYDIKKEKDLLINLINELSKDYGRLGISQESINVIAEKVFQSIKHFLWEHLNETVTEKTVKISFKKFMNRFILGLFNNDESKLVLKKMIKSDESNYKEVLLEILLLLNEFNIVLNDILTTQLIECNDYVANIIDKCSDNDFESLLKNTQNDKIINDNLKILFEVKNVIKNTNVDDLEIPALDFSLVEHTTDINILNIYSAQLPEKLLTYNQEIELFKRLKNGDKKAREILVVYNQKLIIKVIPSYIRDRIDFLDLLQEGNLALLKAIENFDLEKGCKFSTYASWWIQQRLTRWVELNERPMFLGYANEYKIRKLMRERNSLEQIYGFVDMDMLVKNTGLSENEIKGIDDLPKSFISIYNYAKEDSDVEFLEIADLKDLNAGRTYTTEELYEVKDLNRCLINLMDELNFSEREKTIMCYHFGLDHKGERTLGMLGKMFGITGERVRQIEVEKLEEMRHKANSSHILDGYAPHKDSIEYSPVSYWIAKLLNVGPISGRSLKSIYDYYSHFGEEKIDLMLEKLSDYELSLLYRIYGENLKEPKFNNLNPNDYQEFFDYLVPRMSNLIRMVNSYTYKRKKNSEVV